MHYETTRDRPGPEQLLSLAAAQRLLGISRATLYRVIGSGELSTIYIGRRRLVEPDALRAFVASRPSNRETAEVS